METPKSKLAIPGLILFFIGILLGMFLNSWADWGEVEAYMLVYRSGELDIASIRCPLMLGSAETGMVSASFDNPTAESINPTVYAVIGRIGQTRTVTTLLTLAPGEKQQLSWKVGAGDKVFGGLILVNIFETSQRNFSTHQGSCGIPVSFFSGLNGMQMFILMAATSLLGILGGAAFWLIAHFPLRGVIESATNAGIALSVFVLVGMLFILPGWWGLGLFSFFVSIMLIVVIVTQFMLFQPPSPPLAIK